MVAGRRAWISAGVWGNLRGTVAGLIATWFNIPFVLLMGAVGALFGGLTGAVSGTVAGTGVVKRINALITWVFPLPVSAEDLLPTAGAQIGGVIGGLLGAFNGALKLGWMAFAWPWELLYEGDPSWPFAVAIGNVLTALVVAGLYLGWSVMFEGVRLRIGGARRLSRRENEWFLPIVTEIGHRMGLPSLPRFLIDDSREPNAYAASRHVVINQGLLDEFAYDRDAVSAVLAHELAHWRNGDALAMAWAKGICLPLYLLFELSVRMIRVSRFRPVQWMVRVLLWSVLVTVRRLVIPVQASTWRRIEYAADAAAATAGYGDGLRRVLVRFRSSFESGRSGWDRAVCATHPPHELRLERLERPGTAYPLPDSDGPVRPMPVAVTSSVERD